MARQQGLASSAFATGQRAQIGSSSTGTLPVRFKLSQYRGVTPNLPVRYAPVPRLHTDSLASAPESYPAIRNS
jgi:hypothetical protein